MPQNMHKTSSSWNVLLTALMICESVCTNHNLSRSRQLMIWTWKHVDVVLFPRKRWISNKSNYLKPQPNYHISSLWIECLTCDFVCTTCKSWKLSSCTIASSIHLPWLCMFFLLIATINNPISCSWSVPILNIDEYCTSMCFPHKKKNRSIRTHFTNPTTFSATIWCYFAEAPARRLPGFEPVIAWIVPPWDARKTTRITSLVGNPGIPRNLHLPLESWEGVQPKVQPPVIPPQWWHHFPKLPDIAKDNPWKGSNSLPVPWGFLCTGCR